MVGPGFQVLFILFSVPCAVNHIILTHSFIQKAVIKELLWAWLCANIMKTNRTISCLEAAQSSGGRVKAEQVRK